MTPPRSQNSVWPYRFALIVGNTNGYPTRPPQNLYLEATDDLSLGWEVAGEYTMGVDYPDEFPLNRDFFPATSIGRRRYWRIRAVRRIQGGKNNQTYKVEITSRTREGRIFQDEIRFKIKEF